MVSKHAEIITIDYPLPTMRKVACEFKNWDIYSRLAQQPHLDFDGYFIQMLAYLGYKRLEDSDVGFFVEMCRRDGKSLMSPRRRAMEI